MTDLHALVDQLDAASATWLDPRAPADATLRQLLHGAATTWPAAWDQTPQTPAVVLFPLTYAQRPRVTTAVFHHLIDAACEAQRAGAWAALVSVPTGRRGPHPQAGDTIRRIAAIFAAHGLPVDAAGDVSEMTSPTHLVARACTTAYTRRAVDLPALLTAAAADSLGVTDIALADGIARTDRFTALRLLVPLSRLHDRTDPFAAPPAGAKKPPSGSDALWASAFTLALTATADPDQDRDAYVAALGRRAGPLWHQLRTQHLTAHHDPAPGNEPLRIRATDHPRGTPVTIPLFGAPTIAASTRTLVAAAALAGPPTLVIDDLTPRFCYRTYPAGEARAQYQRLADDHHGHTRFLTDDSDLADRIAHALDTLTHTDLRTAAGPRADRRRGALTGFDAVHLAVMGVACTTGDPTTLAVTPSNASSIRALRPLAVTDRLLTCTGTGEITTSDLHVPAHWITHHPGAPL
ncbi:hypothetical protein ABZ442_30500 [Streptomyces triculaminicus]|uniref:hypothetical protein n=1 Tax=Streptomyces triculaminicus TaxID=2816232 RepID=UPI0033F99919